MDLTVFGRQAVSVLCFSFAAFALTIILIKLLGKNLPRDMGREFAVQGALSQGKIRGAGIIMMCVFAVVSAAAGGFLKASFPLMEVIISVLVVLSMLTGYLDDAAETPWSELKKGIADFIICLAMGLAIVFLEPELCCLDFLGSKLQIAPWLYAILAAAFLWLMINAVNCADGIDGLSSSLAINSMLGACICSVLLGQAGRVVPQSAVMAAVLLAYLVFNSEPSSVLMGDAGSRPLGLFIGILFLRMGNALFAIPVCIVLLLDGLLGLLKLTVLRVTKKDGFMKNLRTPLHDHLRKNLGASNQQVRFRFNLAQILVSAVFLCILLLA
ncbi:MAG: phospho-N-acetylmuramoyl-pentapeptide-transferase [Firmicutes bacterium]|nr:phospho-N-acetylmuramoyl-pentapeptide-transferase [Bacillota bacterium]